MQQLRTSLVVSTLSQQWLEVWITLQEKSREVSQFLSTWLPFCAQCPNSIKLEHMNDESFLNCFITTCLLQFSLFFPPCNQFFPSKLNFWNLFNCRRKFLRFWMKNHQHNLDDFEKMRKISFNEAGARIWEICYMRYRNFLTCFSRFWL